MSLASFVALLVKSIAFVRAYRGPIIAAAAGLALLLLALLAIFLRAPHYRATPVFLLTVGSFFAGVFADRKA